MRKLRRVIWKMEVSEAEEAIRITTMVTKITIIITAEARAITAMARW